MKFSNPLALLEKFQARWAVQLEDLIMFQTQVKMRLVECQREWERAVAERATQSDAEDPQSYKKSDVAHLNRECLAFNRQYLTLAREISQLEAKIAEVESIQADFSVSPNITHDHLIEKDVEDHQHTAIIQASPDPLTNPDAFPDTNPEDPLALSPNAQSRATEPIMVQPKGEVSLYPSDPTKRSVATLAYEMLGFKDRVLNSHPVIELQSTAS